MFSVTLTVVNDSSYSLDTYIYDQSDQLVSSATIYPYGQYYSWSDSYHETSDWTEGPFTIRFYCPTGEEYGCISPVANKTTVRAQQAIGHKRCGRLAID